MTGSAIRTPDQRLRVFVSSTLGELAEERRAVRAAVEQLRLSPVMFELGARPHPPRALYRSYLDQSDVFVGIYWQSYGWVAPDMEISGLEDELLLSAGLPRLVYVKRPAPDMQPRLDEMLGRLRDEDSTSYKPFTDPEELHRLVLDDLSLMLAERFTNTAPPAEQTVVRAVPQRAATTFVGRDQALASLCEVLVGGDQRLLTLVGAGGTGKTRLALEAAAAAAPSFPEGVVVVDLSSERDSARVLPDIVRALAPVTSGDAPPMDALEGALRGARMLLLLDNFEQVTAAAPDVAVLVQRCRRLSVLVTSRESLRVRGETVVPLPPLELPGAGAVTVATARRNPAVRLFLDRADDVAQGFALDAHNLDDVVSICRRLDGLPLAIELAAARLHLFTVSELRDRLGQGLDELRGGARDLPERQQALRRTIEWSVALLDEPERNLLMALSAFSGVRLPDLEAVATRVPELERLDVVEGIGSLLDKSLVHSSTAALGRPRLAMLETINTFVDEMLTSRPELAARVQRAHAEHYAGLARHWRSGFGPDQRAEMLATLDDEHGNLRGAWSYWVGQGDVPRMNDLLELLWGYYDAQGAYHEAVALGDDLLDVLSLQPATVERVRDEIAMQASIARSMIAVRGYTEEVERRITAALARAGAARATSPRFPVLRALGTLHLLRAELPRSRAISDELLGIAHELRDPILLTDAHQLAGIAQMSVDLERGLQHLDASIDYFEASPPPRVQFRIGPNPGVVAHVISGLLLWIMGFPDRARRRVDRGLDLAVRTDHPYTHAYALFHVSLLALWRRDLEQAAGHAEQLRTVAAAHNYPIWTALSMVVRGAARVDQGPAGEALAEVESGFALYGTLDTPPVFWSGLLAIRASCCLAAGRLDDADRYVDEATAALWQGDPTEVDLAILRGELMLARPDGDPNAAAHAFERAATLAEQRGTRMSHLDALTRLAVLRRGTPDELGTCAALREALNAFTEGHQSSALLEAAEVLSAGPRQPGRDL
jgi:predicted ATPase